MINNDQALYFVLEILSQDSEWCDTTAIRMVHGTELPHPWTAWVMKDPPFKVSFGIPSVFSTRYEINSSPHLGYPRRLIQTTGLLLLDSSVASTTLPFFLASDTNRSPMRYEVTVQFLFDTVDFLPQIQACIADRMQETSREAEIDAQKGRWRRLLEWLIYRGYGREAGTLPAEIDFEMKARSQKPFSGLYLPVSVGDVEVPGVLLLKEALGERIFRATLYASDILEKIQMPVTLTATGSWWERDEHHAEQHIIKKVLGSIVEIT